MIPDLKFKKINTFSHYTRAEIFFNNGYGAIILQPNVMGEALDIYQLSVVKGESGNYKYAVLPETHLGKVTVPGGILSSVLQEIKSTRI